MYRKAKIFDIGHPPRRLLVLWLGKDKPYSEKRLTMPSYKTTHNFSTSSPFFPHHHHHHRHHHRRTPHTEIHRHRHGKHTIHNSSRRISDHKIHNGSINLGFRLVIVELLMFWGGWIQHLFRLPCILLSQGDASCHWPRVKFL